MRVRIRQYHNGDWTVEAKKWWQLNWEYWYHCDNKDESIEAAKMIKYPVIEEIK